MADFDDIIGSGYNVVGGLEGLGGMPEQQNQATVSLTQFINANQGTDFKPGEIKDLPEEAKKIISTVHGPAAFRTYPEHLDKRYDTWAPDFTYLTAIPQMEKLGEKYGAAATAPAGHKEIQGNLESMVEKGEVSEEVAKTIAEDTANIFSKAQAKQTGLQEFDTNEFRKTIVDLFIKNRNTDYGLQSCYRAYLNKATTYVKENAKGFKQYMKDIVSGVKDSAGDMYEKFKDLAGTASTVDKGHSEYLKRHAAKRGG